jgi:tetratricopeptide (TPR) repeat protein
VTPDPASAPDLAQQAMRAYRRGELSAAADGFRAASAAYAHRGDELAAAEAANNLCVTLLQADRPMEALESVQGTAEAFERHQELGRAAQAYGNLGTALDGCGRTAEAEAAYQRSLELFRSQGDREGESLILQRLSQIRLRQGQPIEALTAMQASLEAAPRGGLLRRWVRSLLSLPARFFSG